jgi:hypothetical protein
LDKYGLKAFFLNHDTVKMIHEIILLNRIYKTNEFVKIKPRIVQDKLVFVEGPANVGKLGGSLTKAQ